jgi:hypothetical protein
MKLLAMPKIAMHDHPEPLAAAFVLAVRVSPRKSLTSPAAHAANFNALTWIRVTTNDYSHLQAD